MGPVPLPNSALLYAANAPLYPSWRHTTSASRKSQPSSHTVPQKPAEQRRCKVFQVVSYMLLGSSHMYTAIYQTKLRFVPPVLKCHWLTSLYLEKTRRQSSMWRSVSCLSMQLRPAIVKGVYDFHAVVVTVSVTVCLHASPSSRARLDLPVLFNNVSRLITSRAQPLGMTIYTCQGGAFVTYIRRKWVCHCVSVPIHVVYVIIKMVSIYTYHLIQNSCWSPMALQIQVSIRPT